MKISSLRTSVCYFLLSIFLVTAGCETKKELSAYVFDIDDQGIANPNELTAPYVKSIGSLTTNSYATMLKEPEPKWSRIVIRNRNIPNGKTDTVYDLNVSDQFRFEVDGGITSVEKPSNSATYIIDITNSGKHSIAFRARPATENELAQNVVVGVSILAILGYLIYIL